MSKFIRTGIIITGDASGAIKSVKLTDAELKNLNDTQAKTRTRAKDLADQWGDTAKKVGIMAGAAATAAALVIKHNIDQQDSYAKLSQRVGVAVEMLAGYEHAAQLSGATNEKLAVGLRQLNKNVLDFANGTGEAQVAFRALNIQVKDASGQLKSNDQILVELADRFARMKDGAEKTGYAMRIFGESGADLIPMLNQGSAGLAAMVAEGQRLNPVTAESARLAEQFNDNITRLRGEITRVATSFTSDLLPGLAEFSDRTIDFIQSAELDAYLESVEFAALGLAGVMVGRLTPAIVASTAATTAAIAEQVRYQAALARMAGVSNTTAASQLALASATGATTAAMRGFVTLLGGPLGVVATAATGGMYLLVQAQKEAAAAAWEQVEAFDAVLAKLGELTINEVARAVQAEFEHVNALKKKRDGMLEVSDGSAFYEERVRKLNLEIDAAESNHGLLLRQLERLREGWKPATSAVESNNESLAENISNAQFLTNLYRTQTQQIGITADQYLRLAGVSDQAGESLSEYLEMLEEGSKRTPELARHSRAAVEQMERDWMFFRNSLSDSFADMIVDGENVFDSMAKSFERMLAKMAGDLLASGVLSFLTGTGGFNLEGTLRGAGTSGMLTSAALSKFAPGLAKTLGIGAGTGAVIGGVSTPVLTEAGYLSLMGGSGAAGTSTGLIAGLKGALTSVPGWGWALAGAAALTAMFDKKSTPSFNAGFLLHDLAGVSADRKFDIDPFASGLTPVGFNRRSTTAESQQVIELFRAIDSTIVSLAQTAGKTVSTTGLRGLAETGLGSGIFFGAAGEDGRPGMAVQQQLDMFASQLIQSLRGQIADSDLESILSAGGVDAMLAKMEEVMSIHADVADAALDAAQQIERGYDVALNAARSYVDSLREEHERLYDEQRRLIEGYFQEQMRMEEDLHRRRFSLFQQLQGYTSSLLLGELSTLSTRERLTFAQGQFRSLAGTALNTSLSMEDRLAAAEGLQGAADAYLRAGQGVFASSSGYKDIFAEVMQSLEAAKFLGTNKTFDGTAIENAMLTELEKLNEKMALLAQDMASQLAPMFGGLVQAMMAAGKSTHFAANTITGLGPDAVNATNKYLESIGAGSVSDYATTATDIRDAVAHINATSSSEREAVERAVALAQEHGVSSASIRDALGMSEVDAAALLAKYNIPMFASGGYHSGGLAMVGEQGPELIYTPGPAQVYNHQDSMGMVAGGKETAQKLGEVVNLLTKQVDVTMRLADHLGQKSDAQVQELREMNNNLKARRAAGSAEFSSAA